MDTSSAKAKACNAGYKAPIFDDYGLPRRKLEEGLNKEVVKRTTDSLGAFCEGTTAIRHSIQIAAQPILCTKFKIHAQLFHHADGHCPIAVVKPVRHSALCMRFILVRALKTRCAAAKLFLRVMFRKS